VRSSVRVQRMQRPARNRSDSRLPRVQVKSIVMPEQSRQMGSSIRKG
jgi:hypothetical protein